MHRKIATTVTTSFLILLISYLICGCTIHFHIAEKHYYQGHNIEGEKFGTNNQSSFEQDGSRLEDSSGIFDIGTWPDSEK